MACRIITRSLNLAQYHVRENVPKVLSSQFLIGNQVAIKRLSSTDSTVDAQPIDLKQQITDPRIKPGYTPPVLPKGLQFAVGPDLPKKKRCDGVDKEKLKKILMELSPQIDSDDMPAKNMPNPYKTEPNKCILCQYNVNLDYKNVRLLSQFVSPYTGRILPRYRTGLCIPMQKHIAKLIKRSRCLGFMPYMYKKSEFYDDPIIITTKLS